jgi:hypothetical protein
VTLPLDGVVLPPDATISTDVQGSGEGRLMEIDGPAGRGRVHVQLQNCGECEPLPPTPTAVADLHVAEMEATSASIEFLNASSDGQLVESYEIRYRQGMTMTAAEFDDAIPAPMVRPDLPGTTATVMLTDLKPATAYVLGVRSVDRCAQRSTIAVVEPFQTPVKKFTQLSGCFVATAAYGSALEPQVESLRRARDRLRAGSPLFAAATDVYYRSGPAAAAVVGRSDVARTLARRVLAPLAAMAEALDAATVAKPLTRR